MATIRVDSNTIQDHFDESCAVKVTGFSWSEYNGIRDVEYDLDVSEDLVYDDDDYIEFEEYNELKDKLQEMTDEFQESQDELATVKAELEMAKLEREHLDIQVKALIAVINTKTAWYKFW
jgi:ribosomal protein L29